ncbi:MAG TPA: DUF1428 domain-containing protein [Caulobacterales bacterium]|nr:DUF1428 domain-containing protein [Caulobacterales bacterium]
MYITCFVIPVPKGRLDAYKEWARASADILKQFGCIEVVEALGDQIPLGKETDFRRAVKAEEDELIVLAWKIWRDKESLEEGEARLHESGLLDSLGEPPFDAKRLIVGCFDPFFSSGRA